MRCARSLIRSIFLSQFLVNYSEAQTINPQVDDVQTSKKDAEHFYDNIIIKFNKNCLTDLNLSDYYRQALISKGNDADGHSFAAFGGEDGAHSGVDADGFTQLLNQRLIHTRETLNIRHSGDDVQDAKILRQARRRRLQSRSFEERLQSSTLKRSLSEVPAADREEEILASLHLLAASKLVGTEKAATLLEYEESGDTKQFNDLLTTEDKVGVKATNVSKAITEFETLDFLEIHIVKNNVLQEALHPLTKLLPCLAVEPEPDSAKESLSLFESSSSHPLLRKLSDSKKPTMYETDTTPSKHENDDKELQSLKSTSKAETVFIPPNDPHFDAQWYLKGAAQSEKFGSHVIDGWSSLIKELKNNQTGSVGQSVASDKEYFKFTELMALAHGMEVAVLDSGCSKNPDLVNQFWRNPDTPGCTNETFVGDTTSETTSKLNQVTGDCVGYDFGNDTPDPTKEVATRIHGSSTSGLIAAEGNNDVGIVGICPYCKIVCLKIYDSEQQRITMTSVVRALDYIGRKNIKLSNHSYGGFGASEIERSAHEALTSLGHLSVCSSGNNACNIDAGAAIANGETSPSALNDPKVCRDDEGKLLGPFTPATYDIDGIFTIGGTTRTGEVAWFSNYGANSVDAFAPGDAIVTLYGPDQLASVKGTSFSAPIVAGMAAVLWSARPELSNLQVKQILMSTGMPVNTLQGKAREGRIVSLSRALASDTSSHMLTAGSKAYPKLASATILTLIIPIYFALDL